MPGLQDNESGLFIKEEAKMNGHWFQDQDGMLYIVPNDNYGSSETEGPNEEVVDRLNEIYRGKQMSQVDSGDVELEFGLERVPEFLFRFDEESGYYTA